MAVWPNFETLITFYEDDYFKNNTWIRGGKPHWVYAKPEFMILEPIRDAIEWTPNTIESEVNIEGNVAHIKLIPETPNLKEYQMKVLPEADWHTVADTMNLKMDKNKYELVFRTVNLANVTGPEHKIIIDRE